MDFQCSCLLWEEDFDLTGSVLGFSFWRWFIEIPLLDVVCGGIVITVGLSFKYGDLLALTVQRYFCKNDDCETHTFMLEYCYKACEVGIKEKIIDMATNASGIKGHGKSAWYR